MRLLATNVLIWQDVKPRYKWGVSLLPVGLMFAAFIPVIFVAIWLAFALHLGSSPANQQSNGLLWLVLFLSIMVVLMLAGYALGWVLNAAIARTFFGWHPEKVRDVFLESKIPAEWRGPEASATTPGGKPERQRASWAVTRQKGCWHYVLVRGVLGWGFAMFFAMGLMPLLTQHREPTLPYLVVQVSVWAIGAAVFGLATWVWMEWLFKRQSASDGSSHL